MRYLYIIVISFLFTISLSSCEKESSCYDESLVGIGVCPTHCPGFEGCDGKTYCNQCEAANYGIGPKE